MESHKYKPEELIFHVYDKSSAVANDNWEIDMVCFTTKECWENEQCMSDDLGSHNIPESLKECGVNHIELMESVFEIKKGIPIADVRTKLLEKGFTENAEFSKFINENGL